MKQAWWAVAAFSLLMGGCQRTSLEGSVGSERRIVEDQKLAEETTFWVGLLSAKYHRFQVPSSMITHGAVLRVRDQDGTATTAGSITSHYYKGPYIVRIVLLPLGSTDWSKADRVQVNCMIGAQGVSSSTTMPMNNPYKLPTNFVAETGVESEQGGISRLLTIKSWHAPNGTVSTSSKPDRSLTFELIDADTSKPEASQKAGTKST